MKFTIPKSYTSSRAWGAVDIATIEGASVRLHWADKPYKWHVNDGDEVFVVLDGMVDMHYRDTSGQENIRRMRLGDIFYAGEGEAHVAHPVGEARMLVIEKQGSV